MALIAWDERLSVNIKSIDRQHRKMVRIVNELHDATKDRRGKDVIAGLLVELVDYSGYHFDTEEEFFQQYRYPGLTAHRSEHGLFKARLGNLSKQFEGGNRLIVVEMMDWLRDWLRDHIVVTDRQYGPYLNIHGVY